MRNAVGVFDTSPLFKYRITGPDAVDFLSGVVVRDLSTLRAGRAAHRADIGPHRGRNSFMIQEL